jgi:hypothetical protein
MSDDLLFALAMFGLPLGLALGAYLEARIWRGKGDHDYMNTKESGGSLYTVKRIHSVGSGGDNRT